jgi:hypothetical protein
MKRLSVGIVLLIFFAASMRDAVADISSLFEADLPASFFAIDHDSASDNARGRRSVKRVQRGKSSLKGLPMVIKPAPESLLRDYVTETSLPPRTFKSTVYQQIHVYRI